MDDPSGFWLPTSQNDWTGWAGFASQSRDPRKGAPCFPALVVFPGETTLPRKLPNGSAFPPEPDPSQRARQFRRARPLEVKRTSCPSVPCASARALAASRSRQPARSLACSRFQAAAQGKPGCSGGGRKMSGEDEQQEQTIAEDLVVTKYKMGGDIANRECGLRATEGSAPVLWGRRGGKTGCRAWDLICGRAGRRLG
ncbi:hypothetical protein P7K49_019687 [Saguinus oedipus]|uniref:Uncharacterized protein n=1 Tax=Saguinus oedipus TaxID=9490 RepID=A0ABQ9UY60_SAGOE|nr:hypothetical protein P7K49_019687 [Saguinus oedipus]